MTQPLPLYCAADSVAMNRRTKTKHEIGRIHEQREFIFIRTVIWLGDALASQRVRHAFAAGSVSFRQLRQIVVN